MKKFLYILFIGFISFFAFGCEKDEVKDIIPGYPNFKIDLNNLDATLRTPGKVKVFTAPRLGNESVGYSGLLVVSSWTQNEGIPVLYAFDLCCPNEKMKSVKVTPSEGNGTATCDECKKVYNLHNGGYETSGSSKSRLRLQPYNVRREANNTVFYIYREF